jgi:hypothetical protein
MIEQKVLHIKNMVCGRCIKSVTDVLCELGIEHKSVLLGEVELTNPIDTSQKEKLKNRLNGEGFELIDNKKSRIIAQIKKLLLELSQKEYSEKKIF